MCIYKNKTNTLRNISRRRPEECEAKETCKVSRVLDTTDIQSFPLKLKNSVMLGKITSVTDITCITEDNAERGLVKRGIEIELLMYKKNFQMNW